MSLFQIKSNASLVDPAQELVAELHRNPDIIPPYNSDLMKQCIKNITNLTTLNQELFDANREDLTESVAAIILGRQAAIDRIKRCCCTYIETRKNKIKSLRWQYNGLPPEEIRKKLSPEELDWLKNYSKMISEFQFGFGESGLNLMLHTNPPKNLLIQVKVLKDYGEYEMTDGNIVNFMKNALHQLPSIECQGLIKQGVLEEVHSATLSSG